MPLVCSTKSIKNCYVTPTNDDGSVLREAMEPEQQIDPIVSDEGGRFQRRLPHLSHCCRIYSAQS